MKDVQMGVLKKLMASMGERELTRLPKKTGSAVLEITMRDNDETPEEKMDIDDGQDGDFDEDGLDPRLAAIMKKKKSGGAPC